MPLFQKVLLWVPVVPLGLIVIIGSVALSILGLTIVWRIVPRKVLKAHNELTTPIFGAIALAYTVLLAFVVVVSWQNYDLAKAHVEKEANCLVDLYRGSAGFAEPFQNELRAALKEYEAKVVGEEWSMLARGQESISAREALRKVWDLYANYEPITEKEKAFFSEALYRLDELREARRMRIVDSRTGVHPILWFVLIVGAATTIGFTFFFGSDEYIAHVIMASVLAVLISMILFTIFCFDYPFTGSISLDPQTYMQIVSY